MPDEIQKYNIEGFYIFDGDKVIQTGKVSYYSDGRLVGLIRDRKVEKFESLLLGVYDQRDCSLVFWKLPPNKRAASPILHSLASEKLNSSEIPIGTYLGFWTGRSDIPCLRNLDEILSASYVKLSPELLDIPIEQLVQVCFNQELLKYIERAAAQRGFRIRLTFTKEK